MGNSSGGVLRTFVRSVLGAIGGSVAYGFHGIAHSRGVAPDIMMFELPLWLLSTGATALPVAIGSVVAGQMASTIASAYRLLALIAVGSACVAVSIIVYPAYMGGRAPGIHWAAAWLFPATAALIAFVLGAAGWPSIFRVKELGAVGR